MRRKSQIKGMRCSTGKYQPDRSGKGHHFEAMAISEPVQKGEGSDPLSILEIPRSSTCSELIDVSLCIRVWLMRINTDRLPREYHNLQIDLPHHLHTNRNTVYIAMPKSRKDRGSKYRTSIVVASHGKHANPQRQRVEAGKDPVQEPNPGYTGVHQARQAIVEMERNDKTGKKNWTIMDRTIGTGVRRYFVIELPESKIPRPGTMVTKETASIQIPFASSDVSAALPDAASTAESQTADDKSAEDCGRDTDAEGSLCRSASPPSLDNAFKEEISFVEFHGTYHNGPDGSHSI
jgi:hypothetical protein